MPALARIASFCLIGLALCGQTACNAVPRQALRQSQFTAMRYYQQNQTLAMERDQAQHMAQSLQSNLDLAHQRLDNLNAERSNLHDRYISLLKRARNGKSPLSDELTDRLRKLSEKYPEFEFDPVTGVSKFHSDILFSSGSAEIKSTATPILSEFAAILNEGEAKRLDILVVGHTDDKPIAKPNTRAKHPTNWHLSTNRANSVVHSLSGFGIKEDRMGAAGYSMYQPVVANKDDQARQINRRVEIYVLAPEAFVAGWERGSRRH